MSDAIKVLDKGSIRLRKVYGDDLTVANAARVSFDKRSESLSEKDIKIIQFLAKHDHSSPFRHVGMQFEVYAPLMVARQWWKYVVGSAHLDDPFPGTWNESSRRYITENVEFYVPGVFLLAPEDKKQGSGAPMSPADDLNWQRRLIEHQKLGAELYEHAISEGMAPEQARLFLAAYGLYVRWMWTASLQSVAHFVEQRMGEDAQSEIRQYAEVVGLMMLESFPVAAGALNE